MHQNNDTAANRTVAPHDDALRSMHAANAAGRSELDRLEKVVGSEQEQSVKLTAAQESLAAQLKRSQANEEKTFRELRTKMTAIQQSVVEVNGHVEKLERQPGSTR